MICPGRASSPIPKWGKWTVYYRTWSGGGPVLAWGRPEVGRVIGWDCDTCEINTNFRHSEWESAAKTASGGARKWTIAAGPEFGAWLYRLLTGNTLCFFPGPHNLLTGKWLLNPNRSSTRKSCASRCGRSTCRSKRRSGSPDCITGPASSPAPAPTSSMMFNIANREMEWQIGVWQRKNECFVLNGNSSKSWACFRALAWKSRNTSPL